MKQNWRYSKRGRLLHLIAYLMGVPELVQTKVVKPYDGSMEPGMCFRSAYHDGPCNGYPTDTCWQHHPG